LSPFGTPGDQAAPQFWFVDDWLLVAEKPADLLAVPGRGEAGRDHLWGRVQVPYPDALIVHRLDMATSGLIVMARGPESQRRLHRAFAQRLVHKTYHALVEGQVDAEQGTIAAPLICDWPNRPRQIVDTERGKPALTHWRVLERLARHTRLRLEPVTGRSHQLRVHLQSIGHPICGDTLYNPAAAACSRLALHAAELRFAHPEGGQPCHFVSPVPF
jgi:tRNA pseudouridine32 synthase/23S rRNA pseudouridine746 synthase